MNLRISLLLFALAGASSAIAHGAGATVPVPPEFSVTAATPAGATDLKFSEMFKLPVGPKGLEASAKLLSLDGQTVRLVGYMASEELPTRGQLILAPLPVALGDEDESLSDDLPASAVFVHLEGHAGSTVPNLHGLLQLVGTLQVGPQDEPDGHVSTVRLLLDRAASRRLLAATRGATAMLIDHP